MKSLHIRTRDAGTTELPVGKIICLGRNYAEHAKEMGAEIPTEPVLFLKPPSSIIYNGEDIVRPSFSQQLHHEVELIVAIGSTGKNIPESRAFDYVLGYGVGLDMTLRDKQADAKKKGLPWSVAKGFDTSAPISEIIPKNQIPDPKKLEIRCLVNGTERQRTSISKMLFPVEKIISYCSTIFTLEEGDLIFTGTPEGVSELNDGDTIEAELVGFTKITHHVRVLPA
jgi:2-keto-4-pentenoate hydratase/2-oxohepta-3-ene-1,7-dioic acid hydratase in catechol pathway